MFAFWTRTEVSLCVQNLNLQYFFHFQNVNLQTAVVSLFGSWNWCRLSCDKLSLLWRLWCSVFLDHLLIFGLKCVELFNCIAFLVFSVWIFINNNRRLTHLSSTESNSAAPSSAALNVTSGNSLIKAKPNTLRLDCINEVKLLNQIKLWFKLEFSCTKL